MQFNTTVMNLLFYSAVSNLNEFWEDGCLDCFAKSGKVKGCIW